MRLSAKLDHYWEAVNSSYWFVPSLMLIASIASSFVLLSIAPLTNQHIPGTLYIPNIESAHSILVVIAGSMITVTGVVFSMTMVSLTLASQQFGPHILSSFVSDKGNQVTLGTFIGCFSYAIVVLTGTHDPDTIPQLAVMGAIVYLLLSVVILIYFIHHIITITRGPSIVRHIADDLCERLDNEHYSQDPRNEVRPDFPKQYEAYKTNVNSIEGGYLRVIDIHELKSIAEEHDLIIEANFRTGQFILNNDACFTVFPYDAVNNDIRDEILACIHIGKIRTPEQDLEFLLEQLSEVAVRSLSPGINDPFTAIEAINWLAHVFCKITNQAMSSALAYHYVDTSIRLVRPVSNFSKLLDCCFYPIREHGKHNVAVCMRLLDVYRNLVSKTNHQQHLAELERHIIALEESMPNAECQEDNTELNNKLQAAHQALREQRTVTQ